MVGSQTPAQLYEMRDMLEWGVQGIGVFLSNSCNPSLRASTDASMVQLRDALLQRYPLSDNRAVVQDQQVQPVPVLNTLGVQIGTGVRFSVSAGVVTGIRLV